MLKFKMDYFYFKIYYLDNVYNRFIIYKNTVKEPKNLILTILVLIGT